MHFFLSSVLIGLIECSAGILMVPSINLAVRLHKFQTQKEYILSPPTLTAWQECRGSQTHSSKKRRGLNSEDIVILCTRGNRKRRHIAVPGFLPFPSLLCNHLIFFSYFSMSLFTKPAISSVRNWNRSVPPHMWHKWQSSILHSSLSASSTQYHDISRCTTPRTERNDLDACSHN